MEDEKSAAHVKGALKMWERRRAEGVPSQHTEESKAKMRSSRKNNRDGIQALVDRCARLEARLRGFGFSDEEIRML